MAQLQFSGRIFRVARIFRGAAAVWRAHARPARGWLLGATLNTPRSFRLIEWGSSPFNSGNSAAHRAGGALEQPLRALGPQAALGICAGSSTLDARLALVAVSIVVFLLQAVILLEDWAHAAIARHGECLARPALHAVA